MKIIVWAQTSTSRSRVKKAVEIDDEDADCVEEIAHDMAMDMVEWGYDIVVDEEDE